MAIPFAVRRVTAAVMLVLACAARAAEGQSPMQRQAVEAFRDSLSRINDSTALLSLEQRLIAHASREQRDSAMAHLRLGFLALRLGDVVGHKHFEDAASEFQWAVDLQDKWPYGWFGLGLAELGVGDAQFAVLRGLQTALGKDALTRSANDFARSAAVDPSFVRGLVELANTALRQRINLRLDVALAALRRAGATPAGDNPDVELARARVEREVGSPDSALAAVDALLARDADNAVALLEQARARFALGRLDGNAPWYRGLGADDSASVALYRADLRFVLPDSTLHAFDAAHGAQRVALMQRFWDLRDQDELRPPGSRLLEHYRRLEYARHAYRLATTHRHYDIVERYRPPVADFDDRGVVYIRQGTPDDRVSLNLPGLPYNESWVYHRAGLPDLLFHFVAREDLTDYRLVESALDILGYADAVRLAGSGDIQGTDAPMPSRPANRIARISSDSAAKLRQRFADAAMSETAEEILRSRLPLNPIYQRMMSSGRGGAPGLEAEERDLGSRSIRIGTSTDGWQRHYAIPLDAAVQAYASAGPGDSMQLRLAYAVPAAALTPAGMPLRLRASVLAGKAVVATIDTSLAVASLLTADQPDMYGTLTLPVIPGRAMVRVGLEAGRAGVISARDTIDIASPGGPRIGLSDVVLGRRNLPLWWRAAAGDSVWSDPRAQFPRGVPMQLHVEVLHTPRDSAYRVALTIRRPGHPSVFKRVFGVFGGGGAALRLSFSNRGTGGTEVIDREIALDKLKPGEYVLEVTASPISGESMTRQQSFKVVP